MDPSNNFSNYRTILKASLAKSPPATASSCSPGDRKSASSASCDQNPFQFPEKPSQQKEQHQNTLQSDANRQLMIPFFSLLVKDLYFLNEGCANRLVVSLHKSVLVCCTVS